MAQAMGALLGERGEGEKSNHPRSESGAENLPTQHRPDLIGRYREMHALPHIMSNGEGGESVFNSLDQIYGALNEYLSYFKC
ncbi:hypothetical protein CDAR_222201 [Caerostris darwini]|uniref:Uncharacterized protein n=1 Tax=Caerostris darwini TaxID=1538125 RepID=A0AAV4P7Y0_9ARAC|nr:hypothetical protein CDAR_222201 [Caerostris darwini]